MPSKTISSLNILCRLVLMASLAACASPSGDQDHGRHHPKESSNMATPDSSGGSAAQGGMMGNNTAAGNMQHMDKESMCAMYRSMRDAPTGEARQAMMDRNMQGMSIEMRERHMEMMRRQCQ